MPQFDVHRNLGRMRAAVPFVVVLQSHRFDQASTRLVVPLARAGAGAPRAEQELWPLFSDRRPAREA